jgi:sugar phosphate isomerase/epimerase
MGLVKHLTFMGGCLARTPFPEQVRAAAAAGFDAITIWPNTWRHAQRKLGLTFADMRAQIDQHGLKLTDTDALRDWVPPPTRDSVEFGPIKGGIPREEFFEATVALGGNTVVAVHMTDVPLNLERDIAGFARLCDDAAKHGLRIALEFVPWSKVPDLVTAMKIIDGAGRANGGLVVDNWHHFRSGGSLEDLRRIPPDKVYTVQISDDPRVAKYGQVEEAMYHRMLPGSGEFDVAGFLRVLKEIGVECALGPELYGVDFETRPPLEVMQEMLAATRKVLAAAGAA